VFVIELIKTDNTVEIYPTITDTAISFKVSRNTISSLISNGTSLTDKGISKINQIRVYKKLYS
jgi:plasmid maintenance system antidote protein VapI